MRSNGRPRWPFPDVASARSVQMRISFEDEVASTALGRRSSEMRHRARLLYAEGKHDAAFALFEQAAALHAPDDASAAAAMCWYDLAETYSRKNDGVHLSHLHTAAELFRRARRCSAVSRDLHRAAKVRNGLASCLRHQVLADRRWSDASAMLEEAASLFREAIELAKKCGEVEREALAGYVHNLGNLEAQRQNYDVAVACFEEAEQHARKVVQEEEPGSLRHLSSEILLAAGHAHAMRRGAGDLERAMSQLGQAIELAHPRTLDKAHLAMAEVCLLVEPRRTEVAIQELHQVHLGHIDPRWRSRWARLCEEAGLHGEALHILHQEIHRTMADRGETLADHTADVHAARAQSAAHLAARLEAARGQPLEAFLTLELVSGMRFSEAIGIQSERAETPLARALQEETHAVGTAAGLLDTLANHLALVPVKEQRRLLRDFRGNAESPHPEARPEDLRTGKRIAALTENAYRHAASHADPAGVLRQEAQRLKRRAMALKQRLLVIAPELRRSRPWDGRLTPEVLKGLLKEHPGHVLIHLSLAEDLFTVAVWLDADELVVRAHRVEGAKEALDQVIALGHTGDVDSPAMAEALAMLDISPALPEQTMAHGVLLPSFGASLLPLAALGPREKTPLDRFLTLSWMPCLSPLFDRQSPHRPRKGTVSIAPGRTENHDIALSVAAPGETRLLDGAATLSNVLDAATSADVLCFYTHGEHMGEVSASLELFDGKLDRRQLLSRWIGMERVELWACASGVNLPHDPLTPPVDEVFGFDAELLKVGVRSTIGTLWPVPDFSTALLVARYRTELARGKTAPRALADAQRALRDDPAEVLRNLDTRGGMLGAGQSSSFPTGVSSSPLLSWAGFRFIGVAERRPARSWGPDDERDLTAEEAAELLKILDAPEPERVSLDDWQEAQLAEATTLQPGAAPNGDQAIRVARLYRDRVFSSRQHNLLSGLAWLHEALAPLGSGKVAKAQLDAHRRLCVEAAWLWLDLARGERLSPAWWMLDKPDPVAAARALSLLEGLPDGPQVRALRAWARFVSSDLSSSARYEAAIREAWTEMLVVLEARMPEGYERIRTLAAVCDMALLTKEIVPDVSARCVERLGQLGPFKAAKMGHVVAIGRLRTAMALLAHEDSGQFVGPHTLPPFEAAREGLRGWLDLWRAPLPAMPELHERANQYLDHIESMLWGVPDDDRGPMWRSSGTLGSGYRRLLGTWMWQMCRTVAGESMALQLIAGLQASTELRLTAIARWSRLAGTMGEEAGGPIGRLALFARDRETVFERLDEAARLPDYPHLAKDLTKPRFQPSRLDAFRCSVSEVQQGMTNDDLIPWFLGESCKEAPEGPEEARTAAYCAVRKAELLTDFVGELWRALCESSDKRLLANIDAQPNPIQSLLDPGVRLSEREDLLRAMPSGWVVVGIGEDVVGRLSVAALSRHEGNLEGRVYASERPDGFAVRQALSRLHRANHFAYTAKDLEAEWRSAWGEIEGLLSPGLEAVLGSALDRGRPMIAILAPGGFRSLPWLGIRVRGRPLFELSAGVLHLPTLSIEPRNQRGSREACVFGKNPAEGNTVFGEAAVETLRRWFEPTVIRPPREQTKNIVEGEQIEAISRQIGALRLYGAENGVAISPVLAGVDVGGGRRLSDQNMRGIFLPGCDVVELWSDTAGAGDAAAALHDERDRIPGLARSFLLSGASHVVDLAWRIPDLVKALLCERFGMLRRARPARVPEVLAEAVAEIARCLGDLRIAAAGATSVQDVLELLDEARRARARDLGLDERRIVPFSKRVHAAGVHRRTIMEMLVEICDPIHLAAARCWGFLQP